MKVIVHEKGITMVGKAWEIREKLKEYSHHYYSLSDWIQTMNVKAR